MSEPMRFVSLVSTAFSGSTLLALLMDAHPEVVSIGELSNAIGRLLGDGRIGHYFCSCGVPIEDCPFWATVQRRCSERGIQLDLYDFQTEFDSGLGERANRVLFDALGGLLPVQVFLNSLLLGLVPTYSRRIGRTVNRNLVIAQAVLDSARKRIFVDASKKVIRAALLQRRSDLDFKMIHLVRDPRGVLNSYRKHRGDTNWLSAARHWKRVHKAAQRLSSHLAQDAYMLVRYEDLCTDPVKTLSQLCRFLDIEAIDLVSAAIDRQHHIIGNRMRLTPFSGLRLDDDWRRDLTQAEIAWCMRITGDAVESLGLGYW